MFHIVYKTTNLINGKIYIGKHSTQDLDDGYLGSGRLLLKAVAKHGKENFSREILHTCSSEEEAFSKERELVTEELVNSRSTYNMTVGGNGFGVGESHPNFGTPMPEERKAKLRRRKLTEEQKESIRKAQTGRILTDEHKKKLGQRGEEHWMYGRTMNENQRRALDRRGRKLTEEHKEKLRKANTGRKLKTVRIITDEHRKKISNALKGRALTEERLEALRLANIKSVAKTKGVPQRREHIEKVKEAKRAKNPMYLPENLGLLKFLKSEGFSSAKIADQLNELGIPNYKDKPHTRNSVNNVFERM